MSIAALTLGIRNIAISGDHAFGGAGVVLESFVYENAEVDTVVGVLAVHGAVGTPVYVLLNDADGKFALDDNLVKVAGALDYEDNDEHVYTISVGVTGTTPLIIDTDINIHILDTDEISLSEDTVLETAPIGTVVGLFAVAGATGTPSYVLTDDAGGKFLVFGNELRVAGSLSYDIAPVHSITVSVLGVTPAVAPVTLQINVAFVAKTILLSTNTMMEDIALGANIGALSVWRGVGTYTFSIVSDPDNLFTTSDENNTDKIGKVDYEIKASHTVTVRANNGEGDIIDKMFTIAVTDVADTTPPVVYPPGEVGEAVYGLGRFIAATATRQYAVSFDLYMNEEAA